MNLCNICVTGMTASFRTIEEEGFHPADFHLIRSTLSIVLAAVWCACSGINPIKQFPSTKKSPLFWRTFSGQINFVLLILAAPLAPVSLIMLFYQTQPFWISISAFCVLRERIHCCEIIGMVICFSAVVVIALQRYHSEPEASSGTVDDSNEADATQDEVTSETG